MSKLIKTNPKNMIRNMINQHRGTIQPIIEIIDNAVEYSDNLTTITINEKDKTIIVEDDGFGIKKEELIRLTTLFAASDGQGFSKFGQGLKLFGAICNNLEIISSSNNSKSSTSLSYDRENYEIKTDQQHSKVLDFQYGTKVILSNFYNEYEINLKFSDFYTRILEETTKRFGHKLYVDGKKIIINRITETKKHSEEIQSKRCWPVTKGVKPISKKLKIPVNGVNQQITVLAWSEIEDEAQPRTTRNQGVDIYFQNILLETTRGFPQSKKKNRNRTSKELVYLHTHNQHNYKRMAIFLDEHTVDAFPIDASKRSSQFEQWPSSLKSDIADIFSKIKELSKVKNIKQKKEKEAIVQESLGVTVSNKIFSDEFTHSPVRKTQSGIALNVDSTFGRNVTNLDKKELTGVGDYLMPLVEKMYDNIPDYVRKHRGDSITITLMEKFIEEALNEYIPK